MPRLLILNGSCLDVIESEHAWIESRGVELLADRSYLALTEEQTVQMLETVDGVILPAIHRHMPTEQQMDRCPRLRVCSIAASGFEWLNIDAATRHGIVVTFAPGGEGAEVVADLAWGLMLAVARQIPYHHHLLCQGAEHRGIGTSVFGKTLGIIGFGQIGRAVARRASGFNVRVIASDPQIDLDAARQLNVTPVTQDELLSAADFISLHVRLNEQTRNFIGPPELAKMKPTSYLINTARRELVDEQALAAAIQNGAIAGAGLDDPPGSATRQLGSLPNVVFTPHLGNRAVEGMRGVLRLAVANAIAVFRGERPSLTVNPEVFSKNPRFIPSLNLGNS